MRRGARRQREQLSCLSHLSIYMSAQHPAGLSTCLLQVVQAAARLAGDPPATMPATKGDKCLHCSSAQLLAVHSGCKPCRFGTRGPELEPESRGTDHRKSSVCCRQKSRRHTAAAGVGPAHTAGGTGRGGQLSHGGAGAGRGGQLHSGTGAGRRCCFLGRRVAQPRSINSANGATDGGTPYGRRSTSIGRLVSTCLALSRTGLVKGLGFRTRPGRQQQTSSPCALPTIGGIGARGSAAVSRTAGGPSAAVDVSMQRQQRRHSLLAGLSSQCKFKHSSKRWGL